MNKGYVFLFITFCIGGFLWPKKEISITSANYKKKIPEHCVLYQFTENKSVLLNVLKFISLNEDLPLDVNTHANVLYLKGTRCFLLQNYESATTYFKKAKVLATISNDSMLLGSICNKLGMLYRQQHNDVSQVKNYFNKAIEFYCVNADKKLQLDPYLNLILLEREEKNWNVVITYTEKCIELIEELNFKQEKLCLLHLYLAEAFFELGNLNKADNYLNQARNFPVNKNCISSVLLHELLGRLYESKGDFHKALQHFKAVNNKQEAKTMYADNSFREFLAKDFARENAYISYKNSTINKQRSLLVYSAFALLFFSTLYMIAMVLNKKNKKKNLRIKCLNKNLENLVEDLRFKNKDLNQNKIETQKLLSRNEQTLFSKVLKLSTFCDSIRKMCMDMEHYIEKTPDVPSYLLSVNKKLNSLVEEEELWSEFKIQFENIRPDFFDTLKNRAPNLSVNDLKHCAYIVSNLKSKEVALLINVSPRSVETTRYRIKKKLGLQKEKSLYDILREI